MHTTTGDGITPDLLADEFTLTTAATRLDFLSRRDAGTTALNVARDPDDDGWLTDLDTSLDVSESLELLALGEVVARKAHGSRLIGIRAALRVGASWEDVAAALAVTPQQAWDTYHEAIAREAGDHRLDAEAAAAARELAGSRPAR